MEPSPLEISDLRLRLRALPSLSRSRQFQETSEILKEISGLGNHAGLLVSNLIAAMRSGVFVPALSLVPLIARLKSDELLAALLGQEDGRYALNTFDQCQLLEAGFLQFETPLLDELFKSFEHDDPRSTAIVESLAVAGTGAALEVLHVVDFRLASRIHELRAELNSGDRAVPFISQLTRGEHLPAREELLQGVRHAIKCIGNRPEPLAVIAKEDLSAGPVPVSVSEFLQRREDDKLEFKAALRWDPAKAVVDEKLERRVIQTVAGFANAKGGILVIGVEDSPRRPVGLQKDYDSLRGDSDMFERHLRQLFQTQFGKAMSILSVTVSFHKVDGVEICHVDTKPAAEPVFIKSGGEEDFYVRNGNATALLKGRELATYLNQRFQS
jgi:hypothetical protein